MTQLVDEVADDVFFCRGADVNWILLRDGRGLTLVDSGYRGYARLVEKSIKELGGNPKDLQAILITHAHVDHVGGANHFVKAYGTPVYTDETEARHARREFLEQATPLDLVKNLRRPGALGWLRRILPVLGNPKAGVPTAQAFPGDGPLDLPGRPVPVPTHGHTSGHVAYYLPRVRAVLTGDELVTGHALLEREGPAILPAFFNHGDPRAAIQRLKDLDADLILPGHGPAWRSPIAEAVEQAARTRP
jgi:glyoxylase-like metal-dependent hydrolase (beta-lactamase superfamily II)